MSTSNERLRMAVPNGELRNDVLGFLQTVGLRFESPGRKYFVPVENMPLDLIILRASEIPAIVMDSEAKVKVGLTGSDLIWEAGMDWASHERVPVPELNPQAKQWSLYFGVTQKFAEQIQRVHNRSFVMDDLKDTILATEYPRVAQEYLDEHAVSGVDIYSVIGTNEAIPYVYDRCYSLIGLSSSGATAQANNIEVLDTFHEGTVRMLESLERMSGPETRVLDDVREQIARAVERNNF